MIRTLLMSAALGAALTTLPALAQTPAPDAPAPPAATAPDREPPPPVPPATVPNPGPPDAATPDKPVADSEEGGRYAFTKVDDGFIRLDMRTGRVSICSRRAVGWSCRVAPDDRDLYEAEIARLRVETALLKRDLLSRGLPLPGGVRTDTAAPPPSVPGGKAPPDHDLSAREHRDLDSALSYVKKAWRRLVELMVKMRNDASDRN